MPNLPGRLGWRDERYQRRVALPHTLNRPGFCRATAESWGGSWLTLTVSITEVVDPFSLPAVGDAGRTAHLVMGPYVRRG